MGICSSSTNNVGSDNMISKKIEEQIIRDKLRKAKELKLLLLGTAESGKTTFLKQLRILHDNGFSPEERQQRKNAVYNNIILGMHKILNAMKELEITLDLQTNWTNAEIIFGLVAKGQQNEPFTAETASALKSLWVDIGVREAFSRSSEYHLGDGVEYFLGHLDRICKPDYMPTDQDILCTKVKSVGIAELHLKLPTVILRVVDVGGQRSERRKWIHCFDDVVAVIFVASISEYNQVLEEDSETNRMTESIRLFAAICNSDFFIRSSIILFLNKKDILERKIQQYPLKEWFPDYTGPQDYDNSAQYFKARYLSFHTQKSKNVYTHFTCATDTEQMKLVTQGVVDMVTSNNLLNLGVD